MTPSLLRKQRGAVAIETALILPLLIMLLLGLFVFWQAFQAQQILTRTAGDTARAAHGLISSGAYPCSVAGYVGTTDTANASRDRISQQIETLMYSSLAINMPGSEQHAQMSELQWDCGAHKVSWQISYQMPLLANSALTALIGFSTVQELTEHSTVHFSPPL